MAGTDSPANAVLHALGFALFVREEPGELRAAGGTPSWLKELWPEVAAGEALLDPGVSPFLENFLIDAEECWQAGGEGRANSGPWVEQDAQGNSVQLEATALTLEGQSVLLLERLGDAFEVKKAMLQKARENVIAYQRLNAEIQKKEILLHCVAEDMTAALANIVTSLRLLELENSSPRNRMLLGLATRATEAQQALIRRVLEVFAEELESLFGRNGEVEEEAELATVMDQTLQAMTAAAEEKKVRLTSPGGLIKAVVPLNERQLGRVLSNLIENALEHSPREIVLTVEEEEKNVTVKVTDDGKTRSAESCASLFARFETSSTAPSASALRLHFCRIILEGAGGEIGCAADRAKGNQFWIRLPKIYG